MFYSVVWMSIGLSVLRIQQSDGSPLDDYKINKTSAAIGAAGTLKVII